MPHPQGPPLAHSPQRPAGQQLQEANRRARGPAGPLQIWSGAQVWTVAHRPHHMECLLGEWAQQATALRVVGVLRCASCRRGRGHGLAA